MSFHHIHVNARQAVDLVDYYKKLFDPATTQATAIGDVRGVESDGVFLLITRVPAEPPDSGGPGWHFGWGTVALDKAYDRHRMQEIDLKLPIESFAKNLHVHLESEDPLRAGAWYRDRFGARVTTDARNAEVLPVNLYFRRPAAIVELTGIAFAIYKSADALSPSRGQRIDHLGFKADLQEARAAGFHVIEAAGRLGPFDTMTIEGPDRLAIELVGAPSLTRPSGAARLARN